VDPRGVPAGASEVTCILAPMGGPVEAASGGTPESPAPVRPAATPPDELRGAPLRIARPTRIPDPPIERTQVVPRSLRFWHAYWVTWVVVFSYLSVKLQARFRSQEAIDRLLLAKHRKNARRIEHTIAKLQGLFIKVGQLISILTNFLPEEFRSELEGLQDKVPARPYKDIEARIREELGGKGPRELFAEFDERPVASASIGQVHRARLHDGTEVAVKVQYPDIEEICRIDLKTLKFIFRVISWFVPYHGLDQVYREIREMILTELDFREEAQNVARISANFKGRADICFPRVIAELSTARVLTTEWIEAAKVSDRLRLEAEGICRKQLARLVVSAYCQQIFSDGVYHADPHPGNLLVMPGPRLVFLDFGATAVVSERMRQGLIAFLQGAISRDTKKLVGAMRQMGFIAKNADPRILDRIVEFFHERFQDEIQIDSFSLKDVKVNPERALESLADLRKLDVGLRELTEQFHVPKEWILLERTILLLMGLCTELDPEMNPMSVIRPYLEAFVLGKNGDWQTLVVDAGKELMMDAVALPADIKRFVNRAQRGELEVKFRGLDENTRVLYSLGHQVIYTLIGLGAAGSYLVLSGRGDHHGADLARVIGYGSAALLLLSMLNTRNKLRRRR